MVSTSPGPPFFTRLPAWPTSVIRPLSNPSVTVSVPPGPLASRWIVVPTALLSVWTVSLCPSRLKVAVLSRFTVAESSICSLFSRCRKALFLTVTPPVPMALVPAGVLFKPSSVPVPCTVVRPVKVLAPVPEKTKKLATAESSVTPVPAADSPMAPENTNWFAGPAVVPVIVCVPTSVTGPDAVRIPVGSTAKFALTVIALAKVMPATPLPSLVPPGARLLMISVLVPSAKLLSTCSPPLSKVVMPE